MDTGEFARFLKLTLKIARYLATSPYTWSDEDKVEFCGRRSLRYFAFVAQMTLYLTYESFVMSRWVQISYFDPKATNKEKTAVQYVAFSHGIPVMLHLCSFFNADQLHLLINRMLLYQRGTLSMIGRAGNLKPRRFGRFVRGVMVVGILVVSLNTAALLRRPTAPHLLTSLIPGVKTMKKWKLIPVAVLQCYIWLTQWSSIYFYSTFYMGHICTAQNALEILKMTNGMTPERFCVEKRTLQVLQCNYNALMRWSLWTGEMILITIVVFGLCGSVWAEGFQAVRLFVVAIFSLGLLVTFWKGLGAVYETSVEVLALWKHQKRPYVRKFLRATRPVRVEIGSYFYADGSMVLTLLAIITENTFNVLLAA